MMREPYTPATAQQDCDFHYPRQFLGDFTGKTIVTGFIDIIGGEINSTVAATVILSPIIANKMFGIALWISEPY